MKSLVVVTGLAAEAQIAAVKDAAIVGATRSDRLAADLEAAIAVGARRLLSFGVAGGLSPALRAGDLVVAHAVRHGRDRLPCDTAWRGAISRRLLAEPGAALSAPTDSALFRFSRGRFRPTPHALGCRPPVDIAGVDEPVADVAEKAALFAASQAVAVDMESGIVARAAHRHGLPFAILRAVADPSFRSLPGSAVVAVRADGRIDFHALLSALARDPRQLAALARLTIDVRSAISALARARGLLGPDFASLEATNSAWDGSRISMSAPAS